MWILSLLPSPTRFAPFSMQNCHVHRHSTYMYTPIVATTTKELCVCVCVCFDNLFDVRKNKRLFENHVGFNAHGETHPFLSQHKHLMQNRFLNSLHSKPMHHHNKYHWVRTHTKNFRNFVCLENRHCNTFKFIVYMKKHFAFCSNGINIALNIYRFVHVIWMSSEPH